jgi:hypothetical protein
VFVDAFIAFYMEIQYKNNLLLWNQKMEEINDSVSVCVGVLAFDNKIFSRLIYAVISVPHNVC